MDCWQPLRFVVQSEFAILPEVSPHPATARSARQQRTARPLHVPIDQTHFAADIMASAHAAPTTFHTAQKLRVWSKRGIERCQNYSTNEPPAEFAHLQKAWLKLEPKSRQAARAPLWRCKTQRMACTLL